MLSNAQCKDVALNSAHKADKTQTSQKSAHSTTSKNKMPLALIVVLSVLCCALWGSAVPGVRLGYKLLAIDTSHVSETLMFAAIRFTLAGASVALVYGIIHKDFWLTKNQFRSVIILGFFQTVFQYSLYYVGLSHTTGVNGSIIQGVGVFAGVIMSCVIFKMEKFTAQKIIGCLLGLVGIMATSGIGTSSISFSLHGEGLLLLATVAGAYAAVITKKFAQTMPPAKLCGWQFMLGGMCLSVLSFALGGKPIAFESPAQVGILLWLIMVSAVAFAIWTFLLRDNDVSRILMYKFTTPLFGVIFSLVVLGTEGAHLGWHTLVGLVCVCLGILIVQRKPYFFTRSDSGRT